MIYYYEYPVGHHLDRGQLQAESDEEALKKMPKAVYYMYRESDTSDGLPFVVVYDRDENNENVT